jgi:hypothetical protein
VGVQQQLAKETKLIAALKQHYERYHAEDLAALKELYEYHAENCVKAAELTEDTPQREEYLKLAPEWTEAATTLQALTDRMMGDYPTKPNQPMTRLRLRLDQEDEGPLAQPTQVTHEHPLI